MIVDISCLANGSCISVAFTKTIGVAPEYNLTENNVSVELAGKVCKTLKYYTFDGLLKANIGVSCDKCLTELSLPVEALVNEKFIQCQNVKQDDKNGSSIDSYNNDEFEDIWTFFGSSIDLTEVAESNLFLNIPYKVLCKEDCKGLCLGCGNNLNDSDCDCNLLHGKSELENKTKNKFEALRSLFDE